MDRWFWLVSFVNVDGDYVREGFEDEATARAQYQSLTRSGHRPTLQDVSDKFRQLVSAPIEKTYKFHARGVRQ